MKFDYTDSDYLEAIRYGSENLQNLIKHECQNIELMYGSTSEDSHFLQFVIDFIKDEDYELDLGILDHSPSLDIVFGLGVKLSSLFGLDLVEFGA